MDLIRRLAPVAVIAAVIAAVYFSGAAGYFSLDSLRDHEAALRQLVMDHPYTSVVLYIAIYAAVTAVFLPLNLITTLAGGLLFGFWIGGSATVVAAGLGAMGSYLAARTAFGDWLHKLAERRGGKVEKVVRGFGRHPFSYVLSLRLLPIFPFWAVSLAAGIAGAPLGAYLGGTLIGAAPASFIYAGVGSGLGKVFSEGNRPNLSVIFAPQVLLPLIALALVSLAPAAAARLRRTPGA